MKYFFILVNVSLAAFAALDWYRGELPLGWALLVGMFLIREAIDNYFVKISISVEKEAN